MATKFKIGDRVRSVDPEDMTGHDGVVIDVDRDVRGRTYPLAVRFDGGAESLFFPEQLKKLGAKTKTAKQTYRGNGKHQWEVVTTSTERLRVPGGWLYRNWSGVSTMVFVPTPEVTGHVI